MVLRQHYVATGYVYDKDADRFLFIFHKKLGKWLPPGGHLLEGEEPLKGALRELLEETGLEGQPIDWLETPEVSTPSVGQLAAPFCILSEVLPASPKEEEHIHIDFVYVLEVDPASALDLCQEEVSRAAWFSGAEVGEVDTFENVKRVCQAIRSLNKQRLYGTSLV